jgi:Glycosyl transferases group 1/Glycosyl transferase 4-like domain
LGIIRLGTEFPVRFQPPIGRYCRALMRVLTLSTYPTAVPRHGGQQRLHHIARAYRRAGFDVQSVGILGGINYAPQTGFLPHPDAVTFSRYLANPLLMEDWAMGRMVATDDGAYSSLRAMIDSVPDWIHVEQPWLFAFAQRFAREFAPGRVRLIYGSQNVEHELRHRILSGYLKSAEAQQRSALILECETEAAASADLVVATSDNDAQWLRSRVTADLILARNGVPERRTTVGGIREANVITGHARTVLYCASAHQPNIVGFYAMFGRGIGFLAPDQRIVVAGGAGPDIKQEPGFARTPGLQSRFVAAGEVSEECLQGLLETCHAVVLPITQGGGTNLKTAEALWAGRWVIATPVAMRGFEHFSEHRGVRICSDPSAFCAAISAVMKEPPLRLSESERSSRRSLLWESTLSLLPLHASASQVHSA